jgi:hypothetical protein
MARTTSSEFNILSEGGDMNIVQTVITSPSTTSQDSIGFAAFTVPDQIGTGSMRLGTVRISTAGGNDDVAVMGPVTVSNVVDAQERAQGFRVDSGTGNDVVSIISSAFSRFPPTIYGNVQINTGDGDDVVNLASENQVDLIQFHGNTVIQTGNQSDRIRLERCQFLGPLNVNTGTANVQGGRDAIFFAGSQAKSGSMLVMLGIGDIAITGTSASPARFAAGVWFGVGRGNIFVGTPHSAQSYVSFDTTHIFAGLIDPLTVTFYGTVKSLRSVRILANARLVRA